MCAWPAWRLLLPVDSARQPFRVRTAYTLTDAEQRRVLVGSFRAAARVQPDLAALRERLLAVGGAEVCLVCYEEDLPQLLARGRAYSGRRALRRPGARSRCHANVARLHEQDSDGYRIATGYALSEDGPWRQHSWGLAADGRPVETPPPRVAYFGFDLTAAEADAFCDLQD